MCALRAAERALSASIQQYLVAAEPTTLAEADSSFLLLPNEGK